MNTRTKMNAYAKLYLVKSSFFNEVLRLTTDKTYREMGLGSVLSASADADRAMIDAERKLDEDP